MAADEMQVHLTAKDDLTRELKNATKNIAKLEAQIKDLGTATDPDAEKDIRRLTTQLGKAQDKSKLLNGAVNQLDENLDAMGYSASTAGRKVDSLGRDMDQTHRKSKTMVAGWGKMTGVIAGVTAAVAASAGAFRLLSDSVNEARQARKAVAQTAAVLKSMGRNEAPDMLTKMIDRMEALSGFDGDEIRVLTNTMLTFSEVSGKTFKDANQAALDLSVAFDKDLQSSAVMVGKALQNPAKGLTALTRIGVVFTDQQTEQVKAMMETGDMAGAQAIIMQELKKQVSGSAAAQADSIAKTQVAWGNLKEAIGETLLASGTGGLDLVKYLKQATKWIQQNSDEIVAALQAVMAGLFKTISVILKFQSIWAGAAGYFIGALARMADALAIINPGMRGTADRLNAVADAAGETSKKLDSASRWFNDLSIEASKSAGSTDRLKDRLDAVGVAIDKLNRKKINNLLLNTDVPGVNRQGGIPVGGDTTVGMGTGTLGMSGLTAAHAGYASALGGHRIISGVRNHNLGSAQSDHLRGRAMDVQGPRLGSYAQVVRRSGGYAAMHGAGANRHLHVVPQTRKPQHVSAGGDTFHATVTVNNPSQPMDIQGAVARGLRQAARQKAERG